MKKFLISSLVVMFSLSIKAMDVSKNSKDHEVKKCEKIIKPIVTDALHAFDIDPATVSIHVEDLGFSGGSTNSIKRIIRIDPSLGNAEDEAILTYIAHHEAAHLYDRCDQKIDACQTASSVLGAFLAMAPVKVSKKFGIVKVGILGTVGCIVGRLMFDKLGGKLYCSRQAELRADRLAIGRLLKVQKYDPILRSLAEVLVEIARGKERSELLHPTYYAESKNMIKAVRDNGCDITFTYPQARAQTLLGNLRRNPILPTTILSVYKNGRSVSSLGVRVKLPEIKS